MNIANLLSTPGPSLTPDGQSATPSTEADAAAFGQALEAAAAAGQPLPEAVLLNPASLTTWPGAWVKIFGSNPAIPDPALDLLQEAPTPTATTPELVVTLTELMAALQPVVNQGSITLPTDEELSGSPGDTPTNDEPDLAGLDILSGAALVQPAMTLAPPPALEVTLPPPGSPAYNVVPDGKGITPPETGQPRQLSPTSTTPFAPVPSGEQSELSGASAGTAPVNTASPPAASFVQELAQQMTPAVEATETERSPLAAADSEARRVPLPKGETLLDGSRPVLPPVSASPPVTGEVKAAATPAAMPLPDVPALHQIVEKMSLISRQGETEVRLQLHPESLGRVLIQLHVTHGEMSVRMLAETAQAQNLIQDHLPQLKAAFSAQGLQLDSLAVNIGSDASAFDMQRRQPGDGSQGMAQSPSFGPARTLNPAAPPEPVSRPRGSLYRVDYQA